jgi:prepilin signal peptidase PulO-like enzyme (type II secretory pathway)
MDIVVFLLLILLGWLCGGLVNHLASVLPAETTDPERLQDASPPSPTCPACGRPLKWMRTALLPPRCPGCRRIPLRQWAVLVVYTLALPLTCLYLPAGIHMATMILLLLFFGLVWVIDVEHRLVLTTVLLAGGLVCLWGGVQRNGWAYSLIGGLVALVILLMIHLLGFVFVKVMGRSGGQKINETAFASGDVALGTLLGLLLGFPDIFRGLFFTIVIAGITSTIWLIVLLVRRQYKLGSAIPYAPFLICGALIILFGGV